MILLHLQFLMYLLIINKILETVSIIFWISLFFMMYLTKIIVQKTININRKSFIVLIIFSSLIKIGKIILCDNNFNFTRGREIIYIFVISIHVQGALYCKTRNSCDAMMNYFLRFSCFNSTGVSTFYLLICCHWDQLWYCINMMPLSAIFNHNIVRNLWNCPC